MRDSTPPQDKTQQIGPLRALAFACIALALGMCQSWPDRVVSSNRGTAVAAKVEAEKETEGATKLKAEVESVKEPSLHGRVLDTVGKPASGVLLLLAGSGLWPPKQIRTDDEGAFEVFGIKPGYYALRGARKDQVLPPLDGIRVESEQTLSYLLRLRPGAYLRGQTISQGKPLANVSLVATDNGVSLLPLFGQSDGQGRFEIGPLLPGEHIVLTGQKEGYINQTVFAVPPQLAIALKLTRAASVKGFVLTPGGQPLSGVRVYAQGAANSVPIFEHQTLAPGSIGVTDSVPAIDEDAFGSTRTDRGGSFEITGLHPGMTTIIAQPDPESGYAWASSNSVRLLTGENEPLEIVVQKGHLLKISVEDERGFPLRDAEVSMNERKGAFPRVAFTDANGRARFESVGGQVRIWAKYRQQAQSEERAILMDGPQVHALKLDIAPTTSQLCAVDDRDNPIEGATISVGASGGTSDVRISEGDGCASFDVFGKAPFLVTVSKEGFVSAETALARMREQETFELLAEIPKRFRVFSRMGGEVRRVVLERRYKDSWKRVKLEQREGSYIAHGVPESARRFRVSALGFVPEIVDEIRERIDLRPAASVSGYLIDQVGKPVIGATVRSSIGVVETDADGAFFGLQVDARSHILEIARDGQQQEISLTFRDGDIIEGLRLVTVVR